MRVHSPHPRPCAPAVLSLILGGGQLAESLGLRGVNRSRSACMQLPGDEVAWWGAHFPESLALCDHPRIFHIPGSPLFSPLGPVAVLSQSLP